MVLPYLQEVASFRSFFLCVNNSNFPMFLAVFEPYKDPRVDILAPKLLFIALNLAALALGVWKVIYA